MTGRGLVGYVGVACLGGSFGVGSVV